MGRWYVSLTRSTRWLFSPHPLPAMSAAMSGWATGWGRALTLDAPLPQQRAQLLHPHLREVGRLASGLPRDEHSASQQQQRW